MVDIVDTSVTTMMITSDGREFTYKRPKAGGANTAGSLGGVYQAEDGTIALIKQEPNIAKNIAEFLGAKIFQYVIPEQSANVIFAASPDSTYPSEDGKGIYVASIYIEDYTSDLFQHAYQSLGYKVPKERPKFAGSLNKKPIAEAIEKNDYKGFPIISALSLLIGDFDIHTGNIGVKESTIKGRPPELARIDYAAAFEKISDVVHPHSRSRHIPGLGPTNHFREYSRKLKLTSEFAAELDGISKNDFTPVIKSALEEVGKYYGTEALIKFGKHVGVKEKDLKAKNKEEILSKIEGFLVEKIQHRQVDLAKFSSQIKTDLCIKQDSHKKWKVSGFIDTEGKEVSFKDVVASNVDYFKAIIAGKESLHFRDNEHKHAGSELNKLVKKEIANALGEIAQDKAEYPTKAVIKHKPKTFTDRVQSSDSVGRRL